MDKYNLCLEGQGVERLAIDYSISIIFLAKDGPYVGGKSTAYTAGLSGIPLNRL